MIEHRVNETAIATGGDLALLRSHHRIEPVNVWAAGFDDPENACGVCGVLLYRVRGGYRHDPSEMRRLAGKGWPK